MALKSPDIDQGLVLALVGESGAGKTTTTAVLEEKGFAPIALSKHLREAARTLYGTPKREQVQSLARDTQKTKGDDYYAKVALSNPVFGSSKNIVIDGLRNKAELNYTLAEVKKSGRSFFLVAVIASDDTRFERVVNRGRTGDPLERAKFDRDDARARGSAEDGFQQNSLLIDMAEHRLMNTGDLNELHNCIDAAIALAVQSAKLGGGK